MVTSRTLSKGVRLEQVNMNYIKKSDQMSQNGKLVQKAHNEKPILMSQNGKIKFFKIFYY